VERLHYIPLSMSYKEIYNIHAYFSGPSPAMMKALNQTYPEMVNATSQEMGPERRPPGDEALERIAKAGRKWKNTIARKVDMEGEYKMVPQTVRNRRADFEGDSICLSPVPRIRAIVG
jgi:hypothetical protein